MKHLQAPKLDKLIEQMHAELDNPGAPTQDFQTGDTSPEEMVHTLGNALEGMMARGRVALVGMGNVLRGDDGAGPWIVSCLKEELGPDGTDRLLIVDCGTAPENITHCLRQFNPVVTVFIDAADFKRPPGFFALLPPESIGGIVLSTHSLPLTVVISYLSTSVSSEFVLLGIQPETLEGLMTLTPRVERTCEVIAELILSSVAASDEGK